MSKSNKYPDGYLPKIAYHIAKVNREKIDYFTKLHEEKYDPITYDDMNRVIDMVVEKFNWEKRHNPNP